MQEDQILFFLISYEDTVNNNLLLAVIIMTLTAITPIIIKIINWLIVILLPR